MGGPEERFDPSTVRLVADGGVSATLTSDIWPVVGEAVEVRAGSRGPWPGTIEAFRPAKRVRIDWTLRSGEPRSMIRYAEHDNPIAIGDEQKVSSPSHSWPGRVTECAPATAVTISYVLQSGAIRRKSFYTDVAVQGFFEPQPDGSAVAHVFKSAS